MPKYQMQRGGLLAQGDALDSFDNLDWQGDTDCTGLHFVLDLAAMGFILDAIFMEVFGRRKAFGFWPTRFSMIRLCGIAGD